MDCKELLRAGELLRQRQIAINDTLHHEHLKLTATEALLAANRDLDNRIKEHGRAVDQSVQLQNEADDALRRGDVKEAKRLMDMAVKALPDPSKLPAAPSDDSDVGLDVLSPRSDKDKGPAPAPQPAPPVQERAADKAAPAPKESGAHRAPAPPSAPDSSGMEERLMAHFDRGFGEIRTQVERHSLPDGYREVLEEFSPDDLRMALKAGRWVNNKRGNPFRKKDQSELPHDNGVAEDGDPN